MKDKDDKTLRELLVQKRHELQVAKLSESHARDRIELRRKHLRDLEQAKLTAKAELLDKLLESGLLARSAAAETEPSQANAKHRLSDAIAVWKKAKNVKAATVDIYEYASKCFEERHPDLFIETIRKEHISDHIEWLREQGKSGKTIERDHGALRAMLNIAKSKGWIEGNPAVGVLLPSVAGGKEPRPYTTEELQRIFSSPVFIGGERPVSTVIQISPLLVTEKSPPPVGQSVVSSARTRPALSFSLSR
jgi:hypothetical protein